MRVLHVISDTNIGGAGVLLCTLLRHFESGRVESVVALPRESALRARMDAIGVPTVLLKEPCDRFSVQSVREISSILAQGQFDLVHANAALCARIAGRRSGVAVLHTRHCCFPPSAIWRVPLVRMLGGWYNGRLSDCIIATADAAKENLLALGVSRRKIEVIPNGSEPIREVGERELQFYRAKWDLTPTDFTVGICARLVLCKGHDVFLHAARLAMERLPNVRFRFLIAGEGERYGELRALCNRLGILFAVRFLGFLNDTAPFYRLLRVNVNCSRGTETSCLALSEGMSAGVPMLVTQFGGNPAMLGNSQAGFSYPVDDAKALADHLCRIACDPLLEQRMRLAAAARYRMHYTAKGMADRVTKVYESLV